MSRVTDPHTYKRRRVLAAGLALSAVGGFAALRYGKRLAARAGQVQGYPSEAPRHRATTRTQSLVQANHIALRPSTPLRTTTTLMNSAGTRQTPFVDQQISHSRHGQ